VRGLGLSLGEEVPAVGAAELGGGGRRRFGGAALLLRGLGASEQRVEVVVDARIRVRERLAIDGGTRDRGPQQVVHGLARGVDLRRLASRRGYVGRGLVLVELPVAGALGQRILGRLARARGDQVSGTVVAAAREVIRVEVAEWVRRSQVRPPTEGILLGVDLRGCEDGAVAVAAAVGQQIPLLSGAALAEEVVLGAGSSLAREELGLRRRRRREAGIQRVRIGVGGGLLGQRPLDHPLERVVPGRRPGLHEEAVLAARAAHPRTLLGDARVVELELRRALLAGDDQGRVLSTPGQGGVCASVRPDSACEAFRRRCRSA
jgi:hypothetical protein